MVITFGVFDLGLDETNGTLISPKCQKPGHALTRLKGLFNEYHQLPQVYAVKDISTGEIVGRTFRNAAARKLQREQRANGPPDV